MEGVMEEGGDISGCSSTTTTTTTATIDDDFNYALADWSPLIVQSPMVSGTTNSGLNSTPSTPKAEAEAEAKAKEKDNKGLRLLHLLMAAAEALSGPTNRGKSNDLAKVILARLKELLVFSSEKIPTPTNMESLALHFAQALESLTNVSTSHSHTTTGAGYFLTAFQLLQDMSPCIKFGHFTANQAIIESVACDQRIHIIDYDIMEGVQWAALMQALVSKNDGLPSPHLRITALARAGDKQMINVQETGRRLTAFAASVGQSFSFSQCRLDASDKLCASRIKVTKGEALVVNIMHHLPHSPHRSQMSMSSIINLVTLLSPRLITVVEEEKEEMEIGEGFISRFRQVLHRYSAVWDSLEAGFPMQRRARGMVEKVLFGPRIAEDVKMAFEGSDGEMEMEMEKERGVAEKLSVAGFRPESISFFNHCQARLLVGLYHEGYRVEEKGVNKIVLRWKSLPLLLASVWSSPVRTPCG
ncbi:putative transcription factor GRAS family [Dioscorea sansibarensis]